MMNQDVNAEIIAIGTEILLGEITDTNSVYIARTLRDIGLNLYYMTSVGDNEKRIADVIRTALSRAQVVITCGGLGPTVDDMTRQAVAAATNRELVFHQELLNAIAERFASFRVQMSENNRRQAYLPNQAIVVENPVGTAPAFIVEHDERVVISLPGVPREMKFLLNERIVPYLRDRFKLGSGVIKARVLRTAGIGESTLDAQIGDDLLQQSNPTVGLAAHTGQVDVRITAKAASAEEADRMITEVESQLRSRIGPYIFGVDDEKIEAVVVRLLQEKQATIAISETGIGTPVSQSIEAAAANGRDVVRVTETYANPDELRLALAEAQDLPIRKLAEQAAERLYHQSGVTAAIAVVSDPNVVDHADAQGGTAIAVYMVERSRSREYGFGGQSDVAATWVTTWSLSMLWRLLKEQFDGA
ncbi:MAG: CinA family nicotinamide mononucleotide deamidase-related protein [Chloroflexi bacterium]|nr:CinA family nicotinamide mononucleotide deamidase-related protein [Chloroflexota bacterium]